MSEASIRTQWKTGQSGNPKGRPRKPRCLEEQSDMVTRIVRTLLDQPCHVLGSDRTETFLTRILRDMRASADLGDAGCRKFLVNIALRGDRDRLQAQRLARKAKKPRNRRFEEYVADLIASPPPQLRPDQQHLILPAREVRTEREKPKPRPKYNPEPELYTSKGELNPWYFDKTDPLGHLPKHLPKEEVRAKTQAGIDALLRRHREEKEAEEKTRASAVREAGVAPVPASENAAKTAPTTGEKTGSITGLKTGIVTGVVTGPISGLRNALLSQQPIGSTSQSPIRVNDVENFVPQPKPNGINGGHVNGHNGSHR
jgi:hypothetical protein